MIKKPTIDGCPELVDHEPDDYEDAPEPAPKKRQRKYDTKRRRAQERLKQVALVL